MANFNFFFSFLAEIPQGNEQRNLPYYPMGQSVDGQGVMGSLGSAVPLLLGLKAEQRKREL